VAGYHHQGLLAVRQKTQSTILLLLMRQGCGGPSGTLGALSSDHVAASLLLRPSCPSRKARPKLAFFWDRQNPVVDQGVPQQSISDAGRTTLGRLCQIMGPGKEWEVGSADHRLKSAGQQGNQIPSRSSCHPTLARLSIRMSGVTARLAVKC